MPLFKKPIPSFNGSSTMLEIHRKVLRRCRMVLIKDLDVVPILETMTADDTFKPEQRDVIMALATKESRVAMFLDRLETRSERAFGVFMEWLKEHQKHLYAVLEEAVRTIDDTSQWERVAMSGEAVRKLLEKNMRRRAEASSGGANSDDGSLNGYFDDDDRYIDCYTLTTTGRMQTQKWIKHSGVQQQAGGLNSSRTYMGILTKDLMFKRVEMALLREILGANAPEVQIVYIVDKDQKLDSEGQFNERQVNASIKSARRKHGGPASGRCQPPPVPPKPTHLPFFRKPHCTPALKPRKSAPGEPPVVSMRSVSSSGLVVDEPVSKPPVPRRKMTSGQSKQTKSPAINNDQKVLNKSDSFDASKQNKDGNYDKAAEDDYNLLNYNISACSTFEWSYETEQYVEHDDEPVNDNGDEDAYEPVGKPALKVPGTPGGPQDSISKVPCTPGPMDSIPKVPSTPGTMDPLPKIPSTPGSLELIPRVPGTPGVSVNPIQKVLGIPGPMDPISDLPMYSSVDLEKKSNKCEATELIRKWSDAELEPKEIVDGLSGERGSNGFESKLPEQDVNCIDSLGAGNSGDSSSFSDVESVQSVHPRVSHDHIAPPTTSQASTLIRSTSDPDICKSRQSFRPLLDPPIPLSLTDVEVLHENNDDSSTDNSFYEDIDLIGRCNSPSARSCATYLDPRSSIGYVKGRSLSAKEGYRCAAEKDGRKMLLRDTLLITSKCPVLIPDDLSLSTPCAVIDTQISLSSMTNLEIVQNSDPDLRVSKSNIVSSATGIKSTITANSLAPIITTTTSLPSFTANTSLPTITANPSVSANPVESRKSELQSLLQGTVLVYNKDSEAFFVPAKAIARHGDPVGEPWFYPIPISAGQAALFLGVEHADGCFLVYRLMQNRAHSGAGGTGDAAFNLSLCIDNRGGRDVVHYHIVENEGGDLMIEGHDHSFLSLRELVEYFQRNKSSLATRLRRCLKEARLPITPGYHYPARYEIDLAQLSLTGKIIGKGYFGVVCGGTYRSGAIAVKVLQRPDSSPAEEDEFMEEGRTMMGLRHDNVVRLIGVRCTGRPMFIVTEYMSRGSLKDFLRSGGLPTDSIDILFSICVQVVSAMKYLESLRYLLHRDLATRNFLVSADLCVKLADFGRARLVMDDAYQASRLEKICIKWASPEVLQDSFYSTKSDIWSAGVVFWEIFSGGERPFFSLSGEQTAVYIIEGGRLDKPPRCPPDMFSLMKACWKHSPRDRPSFAQLHDKLQSKSSIYYHRPTRSGSAGLTRNGTPALLSQKSTPALVSLGAKFSGTRQGVRTPLGASKAPHSSKDFFESVWGENLEYRGEMPMSLSDVSLHSYSGGVVDGGSRDDLTRGDKFRKSLGKLIKMNNYKVKKGSPSRASRNYSGSYE